MLPHQKY